MRIFQTGLLVLFIVLAVGGLISFAMFRGSGQSSIQIKVWGTMPAERFDTLIKVALDAGSTINLVYTEKTKDKFDNELLNAIASGAGPDAVVLPNEFIYSYRNKVSTIPYGSLSLSDFKTTYIQAGEIYLTKAGIWGLPLEVDPLVMYWNRDTFNNAGKTLPPVYWDEFQTLAPIFTAKTENKVITKSAVALGEFRNVTNAKDVLSLLMMQSGSLMVGENSSGSFASKIDYTAQDMTARPAQKAISFFVDFADSGKDVYSWNRSLLNDKKMFIAGDLAVYFGLASEYKDIATKNPNLNFATAFIPQKRGEKILMSTGDVYGISFLKSGTNAQEAFNQMTAILTPANLTAWSKKTGVIPMRRDILAVSSADTQDKVVAYKSAIVSKLWLDPDGVKTNALLQQTVESVTTGRGYLGQAVSFLNDQINLLLLKN